MLNILNAPLLAPPADLRGCEVAMEHGSPLSKTPPDQRATMRFDDQGRIAGITVHGGEGDLEMSIQRDASGCPVHVRQGGAPTGDDPSSNAWVFSATCHADGSLATWRGEHGAEQWSPPRVAADGVITQDGLLIEPNGERALLRQTRRPLAGGAVEVSTWTGGRLQDRQVLSALAGGADARPLIELLPWWTDGRMLERRDAEGRLTELSVLGTTRLVPNYALDWADDGRSAELRLFSAWFDEPVTCDGPRCALPERGWTQVWSCPAR